ncbi:YdeI/OmpD-associated family protein [Foetidibacter luteolus]|uniref:YdeI/OmpD-associated family protein n=1 Tax=Foetidibacter luteolus TaxID=2608880 RepID=UPI00129A65E3|nr:YdeI/OmpD-associated family protein [Foetidibacter luteolus]
MPVTDARIDAYIEKSAAFAQPILRHIRQLVHKACPGVQETMKWSFPHFDYGNEMMCSMAAFKQHCAFGFWKARLMKDADKLSDGNTEAMGHLGRITSLQDLPADKVLISYIKEAALLNENKVKLPSKAKAEKKEVNVPADLQKALKANKAAAATFSNFSYSNKKEYVEWITGAKTEATRSSRLATAIEWMAEGKIRNWKYVK